MNFDELDRLRREISALSSYQVKSLLVYYRQAASGFVRFHAASPESKDFSKATTATCVTSLCATDNWNNRHVWFDSTKSMIVKFLDPKNWTSAGLEGKNPFTIAFLLDAICALEDAGFDLGTISKGSAKNMKEAESFLAHSVKSGAAAIAEYPATSYVTQLVVRVLKRRGLLTESVKEVVRKWSWAQIEHELALVFSGARNSDAFALAYSVMLFVDCSDDSRATPEERQILNRAIKSVFESQLSDGSWPRSRPLFHYPTQGNAYCYEYEMLTQLLSYEALTPQLLEHLPNLVRATKKLHESGFDLGPGTRGWASGHHPQLSGPESWSTASVYHFLHGLDRLLAEAIRRCVFQYVGQEYVPPIETVEKYEEFAPRFLDCTLKLQARPVSVRESLWRSYVQPVLRNRWLIKKGRDLPRAVPVSAIFFGPPGTSKTQLANRIAECVGWPLLSIDPSHLVRRGLDQIQAETNTLFSMLAAIEQAVVLLDEFDEMVRDRTDEHSEVLSRFLTTAMLPKLSQINDRRRILFIVATNHIDQFDFAIRRPGRFDIVIQIMPPSYEAKFLQAPHLKEKLKSVGFEFTEKMKSQFGDLTYAEFVEVSKAIESAKNKDHAETIVKEAHDRCTLSTKLKDDNASTWKAVCDAQEKYVRIPL